jgi:hypothetical protein
LQSETHLSFKTVREANARQQFQPLEFVTRPTVETAAAAYYLNRRPQTLRIWAMKQHPIRPLNIHGRLAWPVAELRRMLGVTP